jgi:hypothetical protein
MGQIFGSGSGSANGPRFPWDTDSQEAADVQSDLADIPDYNYDPGPQNLAPNFEETSFWLDVRPPDEAPAASGCPNGCTSPPSGCVIKGNNAFNTGDKIYHLPGDPYYTETVINPDYGERWFCTEQEAQANGWRHAKP